MPMSEARARASRKYARTHRAQENARTHAWPWRKAKGAVEQTRRSARKHGVPVGTLTKEIMARIHLLPCAYCGVLPAMFADHITPFRLGGLNELSNLAPSCDSCNKRRGAYVLNAIVGKSNPAAKLWPVATAP